MPVPEQTPVSTFTGNGVTTGFSFAWGAAAATHVVVEVDGVELVQGVGYTVTALDGTSGTVQITPAPANGAQVIVFRSTPLERATDYQTNGPFLAETIDEDVDGIWRALQDLVYRYSLAPTLPRGSPLAGLVTLPEPGAGKYLRWNLGGTNLEATDAIFDNGSYIASGEGAIKRTVDAKLGETVSVKDFGAVGDGVVDDRAAIKAAITAVNAAGGGRVLFPPGEYLLGSVDQVVQVPAVLPDFSIGTEPVDAHLYLSGLADVALVFDGASLKSTKTNGGSMMILDGCNRVLIERPVVRGATQMTGSTATVVGVGGIQLMSVAGPSSEIEIRDPVFENCYYGFDVAGDPLGANRVTGVSISGTAAVTDGVYGFSARNNGDQIRIENGRTLRVNRPYFIYGVADHDAAIVADDINGGFQALVKAYSRHTRNIRLRLTVKNRANIQSRLEFSSQHDPATQPTPAYIRGVVVNYTEENCAAGTSIKFSYYQNAVETAASGLNLFDDIVLAGTAEGDVVSSVAINNDFAAARVNIDEMVCGNGRALLATGGFVAAQVFAYTPDLTFDGAAVGMSYTSRVGSYLIAGGLCHAWGRIKLSAKGSSSGSAKVSLPLPMNADAAAEAVGVAVCIAGGSAIPGAILGFIGIKAAALTLFTQGATGMDGITNVKFTDTTDLLFSVSYPV